ncbi:MAG: ATP-binding protein [Acidovorax sp.]
MTKWLPRSLSGQLIALWLLAMLAAHAIAVLALSWWRADNITIHPISVRTIEARVVAAYRAGDSAADTDQLLRAISLPDSRFELADRAASAAGGIDAMNPQEQAIAQDIQRQLELPPGTPVRVHLRRVEASALHEDKRNWLEKVFRSDQVWAIDVDVPLPGGQWLRSRHWPTLLPAHWDRVLSFSLLVGMLPTALIALLFGRRIMRPLRVLTEASRRVSRGERVVLPAPDGPGGIREITQAFNDMQDSLIRFVNGRTQMIAAIGHDLRTPLTSLRIRAELVDDEELRRDMVQTLDEMGVIVEETLQFARDDTLQEPPQDVALDALVAQVAEDQRLQGRRVAWRCEFGAGHLYRCRPVHLKRALNNIIDNAARHGEARVRGGIDAGGRALRIEVDDDGPGIPPGQLEQVFEPFTRLDAARSQHTGGAGLGLAIARSCVRAHGGDVTLHNRPGGGLRAVIALPA